MTVSTVHVSVLLSVVCLGVVFVGGWYLQSSLMELNTQVIEQYYHNQEQTKQIEELNKQIIKQNDQISQQHLQLQQLNIIINVLHNGKHDDESSTNNKNHHEIVKRQEPSLETNPNIRLLQGRDGRDGRDGVQGIKGHVGERGEKGDLGPTGQKGEPAGGVVYVRWGHDSCPSTGAQLVYSGRAGGSHYSHSGGGSNPQCLPLDPNYLNYQPGLQTNSYIYGAEYTLTNHIVPNSYDTDVPCAVCFVPTRTALYVIPAKYTCPSNWTTEYYGYLMAERNLPTHYRSQYTCVDKLLKPVIGTHHNHDGLLFLFVEGRCGSLPCPPYEETKELTCAVCTK